MSQTTEVETKAQEQTGAAGDQLARPAARSASGQLKLLLKTMRPKQWTKNVFVWAALIFDVKLFDRGPFLRTLATFILFCLISGAVYIINDLVDIEKDRQHPRKRKRPLASGALSPRFAVIAAGIIVAGALPAALAVDRAAGHTAPTLTLILYGYLALMIAYSFWLKNIVIVDVLTIAAGFVLRVAAGVVAVNAIRFSPWMYVCTVLLALFLALGKRRQEIVLLEGNAGDTRKILSEYNLRFLDEMLALVSSTTVMAYSFLHLLRAQPAAQSPHDADHPVRAVRAVPLSLPDPRQGGDRPTGRGGAEGSPVADRPAIIRADRVRRLLRGAAHRVKRHHQPEPSLP